jgi:hypothetical protein
MANQDPSSSQFSGPDQAFAWHTPSGLSDDFDDYFKRHPLGCRCGLKRYEELRSQRLPARFSQWRKRVWQSLKSRTGLY